MDCPLCGGTGFRLLDENNITRAARCPCRQMQTREDLMERLSIPSRYRHCTLANFAAGYPYQVAARNMAQRFVENYPAVSRGLLFMGNCGVGKTHLAVAILRELAATKSVFGLFYDFHELLKRIKNSYHVDSQTNEMELLNPVCNSELLLLDDLGTEKTSPWVQDTLYYILNQRYLGSKITLITSNYLDEAGLRETGDSSPGKTEYIPESLEDRIGYRLRSRLYEMCKVVKIRGEDYRRSYYDKL